LMTSFLVVFLYPGKPSQLAAGLYCHFYQVASYTMLTCDSLLFGSLQDL
jgi:hypothetical protein